jgi:hypothetical protein
MSEYDDLVERLAKAVFGVTTYADDPTRAGMPKWDEATPEHITYCGECARAVLSEIHAAGLRIVDAEGTLDEYAAWRSVNCKYDKTTQHTYFDGDIGNWRACHQAMTSASPYAPPKDK